MPTQTVTYDPTNDTIIEEQNAARDAENLEVGEKLVAEQENLLAGKYKTTEDLESAYKELEKKLGAKESGLEREASEETTDEPQQLDPATFYNEDGSVNYDVANEVYGEQVSNIFKNAEIDPFKMNEYFMENNGTLSDEMYDTLGKAGLNKSIVDSYLEGVRQQAGYDTSQADPAAPILTDQEIAEVQGIAGGKAGYEQLMAWATDNLSDEDAKNFDEVIETGNKAAVTFAIKALMGQYEDAQGRDSNLITGKQSPTPTYRSMAEVVRDMNNPLYDKDEAYRDDVRRKLELSNLKV
mgnify:CR=1 FL=1|tara:strand:+ start:226 stop:1113 length:888 start_codon:yes stop_codon:yes gene_type:complete